MSQITITPMENKGFGAVVTNIKLNNLSDTEFSKVKAAFLKFGFLLFPAQFLSDEESIHFGERFGELEFGASSFANQQKHEDGSYSEILDPDTQRMRTNVGNEFWHTDSTWKPVSSKCAILSAVAVTEEGGETELADMRAAYAALDEGAKERIRDLSAYHSTQYSQANDVGDFPPQEKDGIYHGEAYLRPLVKTHPETSVKNLFIGRHAFGVHGLTRTESRELLTSLLDFAVSDKSRVYTHKWQKGDALLWDNRVLLHRANPYDYSKARVMIGTRVAGDVATELAYYPSDQEAQAGREALAAELAILRKETVGKRYGATTAP